MKRLGILYVSFILVAFLPTLALANLTLEKEWVAGSRAGVEECLEKDEFYIKESYDGDKNYLVHLVVKCEPIPDPYCWVQDNVEKCIRYEQQAGTTGYKLPEFLND